MKKLKIAIASFALVGLMSSCQYQVLQVTNNPIGTKTGSATLKPFQKDANFTYKKAAENGDIRKIGSTTFTTKNFGIFFTITTEVTGE
ncbi:MAG: hypothetical protein CMP63_04165 [Flavobacteriales bacterium]|nr:hypothetical protein [Flavobacteriales bacterium]|tara:strand:+ start:7459 stop:7722 length:264 start_codon:yes stop_codon:yes gene_type:complete